MTNASHLSDPDDWDVDDDDLRPYDGLAHDCCALAHPDIAGLDDTGPDDDLIDASSICPPGGVLARPDDVLDFLLPLIGPERAGPMALWCALVDAEDRTFPVVLPIADAPVRPDAGLLRALVDQVGDVLRELCRDGDEGGVVFAVVRRSGGDRGEVELAWAAALRRATDDAGVRLRAVAAVGRDRARVLQW